MSNLYSNMRQGIFYTLYHMRKSKFVKFSLRWGLFFNEVPAYTV